MSSSKLKIFVSHPSHYLTDHEPHGDGLIAHAYLDRLARRGHEIHVACPLAALRGPLHPNITLEMVPGFFRPSAVKPSPTHRLEYAFRVKQLYDRLSRKHNFDIIHQLNPVVWGMSMFLESRSAPLILGPIPPSWRNDQKCNAGHKRMIRLFHDAIQRRQIASASVLLIPTPASLPDLPLNAKAKDKIRNLNYGVDENDFFPADVEHSGNQSPSILFLANLLIRKGILTLIEAFERLIPRLPTCRLQIAGTGADSDVVHERVRHSTAARNIDFLGRIERPDVPRVLRNCSVYCLPSFGEPFGMSALEAMACGKPVVGTDTGGLGELLRGPGTRCVKPGDAAGLAATLADVLSSREIQLDMGRQARLRVLQDYAWPSVICSLENIYEDARRSHLAYSSDLFPQTAVRERW